MPELPEITILARQMRAELVGRTITDIEGGGTFYEVNLYGQKGGFTVDDILIGYKEGKPCPACGTPIEKIKTGSTSSFICPRCQPLEV